jgi:dienelactone hydrolase
MQRRAGLGRLSWIAGPVCAAVTALGPPAASAPPASGLQQDVTFHDYSPLSANAVLLERMLSPLADQAVERALAQTRKSLPPQSIDLSAERFVAYVPSQAPPGGYGVLVFIPPGKEAKLPPGWAPILDQYGIIYVSAERSGNEEDVLARRVPLTLLALENIRRRYDVDPDRVYIGGYSGGARVALRVALSYPDVFRGALLNAGSDPIGAPPDHLPERALFSRFQTASRIAYVTGAADGETLFRDADSLRSVREHCVQGAELQVTPATDHEIAKPATLAKALAFLGARTDVDASRLASCETAMEVQASRQLDRVEALIKAAKLNDAKRLLLQLDGRYGGLARARILDLAQACGCGLGPPDQGTARD